MCVCWLVWPFVCVVAVMVVVMLIHELTVSELAAGRDARGRAAADGGGGAELAAGRALPPAGER